MPNDWGVPPKNFGRFIPCRGGGTATTYYTDGHFVDEDMMTASIQGGWCADYTSTGVVYREVEHSPFDIINVTVASRLIYLS